MKFWNDPKIVAWSPVITTGLFETANAGQVVRMWAQHTSAGQSLSSWICVNIALFIWANYYRVITPEQRVVQTTIKIGITLNLFVIFSVVWFRYFAVPSR